MESKNESREKRASGVGNYTRLCLALFCLSSFRLNGPEGEAALKGGKALVAQALAPRRALRKIGALFARSIKPT